MALACVGATEADVPGTLACLIPAFAVYWFGCQENLFRLTASHTLALGLLARLCLLPLPPSDDIHRFIWEGEILARGFNPYLLSPIHASLAFLRDANWAGINHPDMATIYPPLAQTVFYLLAKLGQSVPVFKIGFLGFDLLGFFVLRSIVLRGSGPDQDASGEIGSRGAHVLAIYFMNPLLIFEIAGHGHFESLPVFFNLAFFAALTARKAWAPVLLGLGAMTKISSLALAPLLLPRLGWKRALAWGLAIALSLGGTLWAVGAFAMLAKFATTFGFNSALPSLVDAFFPFLSHAARGGITLGLFATAMVVCPYCLRKALPERQALWYMGLLLLFAPTLHPWYLLWVLPFAALARSRPWLLLSGTILISYEVYGRMHVTGQWRENPWLRWPEFLPPLCLYLYLRFFPPREKEGRARMIPETAPETGPIRVIIPALNEEQAIAKVLRAIPADTAEVIVVDNGSTDATAETARSLGATVVCEPRRGYGAACLRGMAALPPDTAIVVFLDGDFSDHPEEMGRLTDPIKSGNADLVIGSRALGRREKGALLPVAIFGNWLTTRLVRLGWGFAYTDLGPFRAIRYASLKELGMADPDFGWTVEMQVKAVNQGLRVSERPVSYRKRIGVSKISGTVMGSWKAGKKILYIVAREWMKSKRVMKKSGGP